jgi:hypothetical protein
VLVRPVTSAPVPLTTSGSTNHAREAGCLRQSYGARVSYDAVGQTRPAQESWLERPDGYRSFERTVCLGQGAEWWKTVAEAVLTWQIKIRSGFGVDSVGDHSSRIARATGRCGSPSGH